MSNDFEPTQGMPSPEPSPNADSQQAPTQQTPYIPTDGAPTTPLTTPMPAPSAAQDQQGTQQSWQAPQTQPQQTFRPESLPGNGQYGNPSPTNSQYPNSANNAYGQNAGNQYNPNQYTANQYDSNPYSPNQYSGSPYASTGNQYSGNQGAQPGWTYQQQYVSGPGMSTKSKIVAGLLGIFLGAFGVHNFYLGNTGKAVGQLCLTIFGSIVVVGPLIASIWGLVEGICILASHPGSRWHCDANNLQLQD